MHKKAEICIRPGFVVLAGIFLLGPFRRTMLLTIAAAAVHECGHIAMIRAFGGRVERIELRLTGALIVPTETPILGYGAEILVSIAGALANIALAFVSIWLEYYTLAGASFLLCIGNLFPMLPLDGGRALFFALCRFFAPNIAFLTVNIFSAALGMSGILLAILRKDQWTNSELFVMILFSVSVIVRVIANFIAEKGIFHK